MFVVRGTVLSHVGEHRLCKLLRRRADTNQACRVLHNWLSEEWTAAGHAPDAGAGHRDADDALAARGPALDAAPFDRRTSHPGGSRAIARHAISGLRPAFDASSRLRH